MAANTSRGGSSRHGGGPYADAAFEFLALAVRLANPDQGGRVVLPQSILAGRDGEPVRRSVAERPISAGRGGSRSSSTSTPTSTCARSGCSDRQPASPHRPAGRGRDRPARGRAGDRPFERWRRPARSRELRRTNDDFRDEYYALVPAVGDDATGPPLVTSELIDPGRCLWGQRPVRFAKQSFEHPRVDLSRLNGRFPAWAARKLVGCGRAVCTAYGLAPPSTERLLNWWAERLPSGP